MDALYVLRFIVKIMFKKALQFILLGVLLLEFAPAQAADFFVTSKADSGVGTLRAALTAAAANGDSSPDRILFNLPGSTEADFTILVNAQLPNVSSNLVIDGTSQPGNSIAGTINTHVVIKSIIEPKNDFVIFKGNDVHDVEFYGLLMWDTNLLRSTDPNRSNRYGFGFTNSERITIGKAGKGNWIDGYNQQSIEMIDCRAISIVANTFHRRAGNKDPDDTAPIYFQRIVGLNFGEAGAGNVVFTKMFISLASTSEESKIVFVDNNFAVEADGKTISKRAMVGVKIVGGDINPTDPNALVDILFTGNLFSHYDGYGLKLDFLKGKAVIKHNWFGIDRGNTVPLNYMREDPYGGLGTGLVLNRFLGDLQVGDPDPAQANVFAYSEYGVTVAAITNLLLMRNSFKCTYVADFDPGNEDIPLTTVTSSTPNAITGTAAPGAIVDLFHTEACTTHCSPDRLMGSTLADANGLWQYTFIEPVTWYVTANSHIGKKSSNFTTIIINTNDIKVTDSRCGKLGSIKNIHVSNTTTVKWVDGDEKVVSTSLDLVDVPPGTYKLIAGIYCTSETYRYEIQDFNARVNDAYLKIQQPFCDSKTGSIMGLVIVHQDYTDPVSFRWVNSKQITVGTSIDLQNVGPDTYFLKLTTASGCETSYGPLVLTALSNPSPGMLLQADTATAIITPDDCNGATGAVTGLRITGGLTPYSFAWTDASGLAVGTKQSLTSVKAGTYTLTVDDANRSPCNRIILSFDVPARYVILPMPTVPSVDICGPAATPLRVVNPTKGKYKLYSSANALVPLQENNTGIFIENVTANITYYISLEVGTCSSPRAKVSVHLVGSGINIPNSFTPNGDGVNDSWDIANITEYPNATVKVLNRTGTEVFNSRGYHYPFTGKINNRNLPPGTYYYLIDLGRGCKPLSGPLTILR
ncbi:T9SS type B sorting domain-containing protein [Mucilaginibacter sp. HD30]